MAGQVVNAEGITSLEKAPLATILVIIRLKKKKAKDAKISGKTLRNGLV